MVLITAPQLIFLDAMGTLFFLRQSVGEIYADKAALYGINVDPSLLEPQFRKVFKRYHAPVFGSELAQASLPHLEKDWWRTVVLETFAQILSPIDPSTFDLFFEDVFHYFASSDPWCLFPEVRATLQQWSEEGIELGIISNFDSRLFQVIHALRIDTFFQSVTVSSQAGAAKPDAQIFESALAKHECDREAAVHIGDQWVDDFQGAQSAQLQGIWLNRGNPSPDRMSVSTLNAIHWPR